MQSAEELQGQASRLLVEEFKPVPLEDVIGVHVRMTLMHFRGNKTAAALALGIDRRTLSRMLKRNPHLRVA